MRGSDVAQGLAYAGFLTQYGVGVPLQTPDVIDVPAGRLSSPVPVPVSELVQVSASPSISVNRSAQKSTDAIATSLVSSA